MGKYRTEQQQRLAILIVSSVLTFVRVKGAPPALTHRHFIYIIFLLIKVYLWVYRSFPFFLIFLYIVSF